MASSTRRMSGMVAQAGPGGQALLETMDAFRRKHVSQNKEIIHRNSDLMRNNADLTGKLRDAQNELIASRAENMILKAANIQLEHAVATLSGRLAKAEARANGCGGLEEEKLRTLCSHLDSVFSQLQDMRNICIQARPSHQFAHPVSPPVSPPYVHPTLISSHPPIPEGTSNITKRSRSSSAAPPPLVSAQPDLSLISEASQEPSMTASQRLGEIGFEDDASGSDILNGSGDEGDYEGNEAILQAYAQYQAESQEAESLACSGSRPSSAEPEELLRQIQDALIASPTRRNSLHMADARARSKSFSLSTSPSPPRTSAEHSKQPHVDPAQLASDLEDVLETAKDTIRQTRRRNSGILPPPPKDLTKGSTKSKEDKGEKEVVPNIIGKKRSRPSLVEELGISPGRLNLDLSMAGASLEAKTNNVDLKERNRDRSMTTGSTLSPRARQESTPDSLGKTVRHSTSASGLRESAAFGAGNEGVSRSPMVSVHAPVMHPVRRRKSVPTLSTNSPSTATLSESISNRSSRPSSTSAILSSAKATIASGNKSTKDAVSEGAKRKPLVAGMQGRPSGGPVALVVTKDVASTSSASASVSSRASTSKSHAVSTSPKRTGSPSVGVAAAPSASTHHLSAARERARSKSRSRSTTPEVDPPAVLASYKPVLQELSKSSLSQPSKSVFTQAGKVGLPAVILGTVKKDKGKQRSNGSEDGKNVGIRIEVIDDENVDAMAENVASQEQSTVQSRSQQSARARSVSASPSSSQSTTLTESQESRAVNESASLSAAAAGREGRRARSAVNYQEPSLTKKMRQPAGYVPSIKTVSSTKGVSGHHIANTSSSSLGVRRKSSLEALGSRKPLSTASTLRVDESDSDNSVCDE